MRRNCLKFVENTSKSLRRIYENRHVFADNDLSKVLVEENADAFQKASEELAEKEEAS